MCGIAGICGPNRGGVELSAMLDAQRHRGPDGSGRYIDAPGSIRLGHTRLSIIDLSDASAQPMTSADGRLTVVFNGEIYNYLELTRELDDYPFRSRGDTEVILAAYQRWGTGCLDRLIGMFAFALWDARDRQLLIARDRFGIKPVHYHHAPDGTLVFASEVGALQAAGVGRDPDSVAWATYLTKGLSDHSARTFWRGVESLPPGHAAVWKDGTLRVSCWYDLRERVGSEVDSTDEAEVRQQYLALLEESIRLRFRADVPVGINLSGGLDSSTLLALVHRVQGADSAVRAYTFVTGDAAYDELPWVQRMLDRTDHPSVVCELRPDDVPTLAESVQALARQPIGGLPTLAYARLFERARADGVLVLLDGQGMDEQWAGYDYYASAGAAAATFVQGSRDAAVRPECLQPEFAACAEPFDRPQAFADAVTNLQYRDIRHTKIPRALRFNDAVSMRASTELREPFMDHRLFELALRQPTERKIQGGRRKVLLRDMMSLLVGDTADAPKRPLQTPQREWLRGPLRDWATGCIDDALEEYGDVWLRRGVVRATWLRYCAGESDNSFYVWQWITLGMLVRGGRAGVSAVTAESSAVTGPS